MIRRMSSITASRIFPYFTQGEVVKGFGRGSKELGIPTVHHKRLAAIVSAQRSQFCYCSTMPESIKLPLVVEGPIVRGHRRGSSELNFPTANYPDSVVESLPKEFECGIYFGWASVDDGPVYKMVASETHIIHTFSNDFYGANLKVCVAGYLRPEKNFSSVGKYELISSIKEDIRQAQELLDKPQYKVYKGDYFIKSNNHRL
ncbi:hypothetical protein LSH36_310g03029 [Paralvinella palmiformis]|uniref:riboflavin kinase n=1 Tax=Paralvinella palmiformis TaxID=53620 RepID=A0AAD9N3L4_9ANNE|nr:hypothetical protein LSH36_310g03029 [Paralvinella palmiformis]